MSLQAQIMEALHVVAEIDPRKEIERRVNFLKKYLLETGARGFVLGISGGQDSTLAGKIAQLAVDSLLSEGHEAKFVAVRLPYGVQADAADADLALDFIAASEVIDLNIAGATNAVADAYGDATGELMRDYVKGNVKARMRMVVQYAIAGMDNLLVVSADHAAEAVTGFFTKYGDGAADVIPLAGLTKRQGKLLLRELGATEELYMKVPIAGLLDDAPLQTDEDELGVSYDELDDYLEGKTVSVAARERIEALYVKSAHKRAMPIGPM